MPRKHPAIAVVSWLWVTLWTFMSVSCRLTDWMGRRIYFWGCTLLHQVSVITVFLWKTHREEWESQCKFSISCSYLSGRQLTCLLRLGHLKSLPQRRLIPQNTPHERHVVASCIWHLYSWFPYCGGQATKVNDCTGTLCKYEADMGKVWSPLLEDCFYLFRLAVPPSSARFGVLSQKV